MAKRIDANQPAIVAGLRACGCMVQHLHMVGGGCPDLLVGYQGVLFMVEVKDGSKPPSKQRLTPDEERWHGEWLGYPVHVVHEVEAIPRLLERVRGE